MSMNTISINGTVLPDIYIDGALSYNKPKKNIEMISVPGRSGDLTIDYGTWQNVLITYPCFARSLLAFEAVINTLGRLSGYQKITCTNDSTHYRMGVPIIPEAPTVKRISNDFYFNLVFNCKPQRYLSSNVSYTIAAGSSLDLVNPTGFQSEPYLEIDDAGTITFKEVLTSPTALYRQVVATVTNVDDWPRLFMDCALMECWSEEIVGVKQGENKEVSFSPNEFPVLYANQDGSKTKVTNGTTASLKIYPRWWEL